MSESRRHGAPMCALIMAGLAIGPAPAEAHLNSTGMGPIYDGLLHFLTSPDAVIPALALALLAGLRGPSYGRRVLFVTPAAWLLGGALGSSGSALHAAMAGPAIWFLLLGGLVAADVRVSLPVTTALAVLLGLYHGFLNAGGMGQPGTAISALVGLTLAVFVLVALATASVVPLRAQWTRIVVRVAGSWIAASGLLMLGWAVRAHP